jgi:hypothetical protein
VLEGDVDADDEAELDGDWEVDGLRDDETETLGDIDELAEADGLREELGD